MKNLILVSLLFISSTIYSQAPKGDAKLGTQYGQKFDERGAVPAENLYQMVWTGDTAIIKVKAKVLKSCASEGCWLTFKVNDSIEAIAKMKGHSFFVPLKIQSKTVILDGKAYMKTTSVKELKHQAEEAKKPKKVIDAIVEDKKQIIFIASGVKVVSPNYE